MQRIVNPFWVDVFKHYKKVCNKCIPSSFHDFVSECLFYNINICRDKKVLFLRSWAHCGIVSVGHLLKEDGFLTYDEFSRKYPNVTVNFLLYQGIVRAVKKYQCKLEIDFCDNFVVSDPCVWQCLASGGSKHVYGYLIKNTDPLKCIEKWTAALNCNVDVNKVFLKIKRTTEDVRLRWFQYRLIYRIIPTQRFLHLRKIVESPICTFCGQQEETLEHLFWDCTKTQAFWNDFLQWMRDNFVHCTNFRLYKQLIICGYQTNCVTDKTFDLFLLIAKYHIYTSKIRATGPHFQVLVLTLKQRFLAEKHNALVNNELTSFNRNWNLYRHAIE
eukprot:GHVL01022105.1.p1 GENE.GHVL01022105.1~~GHVL01022105.1.p1  ORF type:complete len:329 (-),score=13.53 GHVL01022105.1:219-1205(-)